MRIIVFLLLVCSVSAYAKGGDVVEVITPKQVHQLFTEQYTASLVDLVDLVDKEEKVDTCAAEYIKKQSKSYAKIVQNNLYDLIHNFNRIASKVYGTKSKTDEITYDEKIGALAKLQCEAYYTMKLLK